jgi:hypothetical protein
MLSLQELEGVDWGEPAFPSYLLTTCYRLRRKPIEDFTPEDLRIMIGQGIGLDVLLPLALDRLGADPLIHGDFFPGDLLKTVLTVPAAVWERRPDLRTRAASIASQATAVLATLECAEADAVRRWLWERKRGDLLSWFLRGSR